MSQAASPNRIEIRTSPNTIIASVVALPVVLVGLRFCSAPEPGASTEPEHGWLILGLALAAILSGVILSLRDRSPRIILDADQIFWREGRNKIHEALAWSEIRRASIEPGSEDVDRRLRLFFFPRPALESVASERTRGWVDISIDAVDISERRLRRVINQRAPHLFTGAARDTIELTTT